MLTDKGEMVYWKAVTLLNQQNRETINQKEVIFAVHENYGPQDRARYQAVAIFWQSGDLQIVSETYTEQQLNTYSWFHLTGVIDTSDYASPEEFTSEVDEVVLAVTSSHVLRNAGYWPEYDQSGNVQWRWMHGPHISEVDDDELIIGRILDYELEHLMHSYSWIEETEALKALRSAK